MRIWQVVGTSSLQVSMKGLPAHLERSCLKFDAVEAILDLGSSCRSNHLCGAFIRYVERVRCHLNIGLDSSQIGLRNAQLMKEARYVRNILCDVWLTPARIGNANRIC